MNHIISSSCNPENENISDLCNIFSKNFHICNEGVLQISLGGKAHGFNRGMKAFLF